MQAIYIVQTLNGPERRINMAGQPIVCVCVCELRAACCVSMLDGQQWPGPCIIAAQLRNVFRKLNVVCTRRLRSNCLDTF